MRLPLFTAFSAVAILTACAQAAQNPTPKTDDEKALYSLGVLLSRNLRTFELTDKELEMVKAGLVEGSKDKAKLKDEEAQAFVPKLQQLETERAAVAAKREKEAGVAFLAKAEAESGARKLPNGMIYKMTQEGTGETPKPTDTVKANYEGRFVSGKKFDSSADAGEPAVFPLQGVIPCWTEGMQQMKVGGKAQFVCPADTAYGEEGRPPMMPGGATLVFDVELVGIEKPEAGAAATPAN